MIQELVLHPKENLKGYASNRPLDVICSFKAFIGVQNSKLRQLAKFFVLNGTEVSLLGFHTAVQLKLLRIGLEDNLGKNLEEVYWAGIEANGEKYRKSNQDWNMSTVDEGYTNRSDEFPKVQGEPVKFRVDSSVIPKQIIR